MFKNPYHQSKYSVIIFKILHIFLGFDYGYFNYNSFKTKFTVRLCNVLQSIILFVLLTSSVYSKLNAFSLFWYVIYLIKYMVYVLIVVIFQSKSTLCFQAEINNIDQRLNDDLAYQHVKKREIILLTCLCVYRLIVFSIFHSTNNILKPIWATFIYFWIHISLEYITAKSIIFFYSLYYRIAKLVGDLKSIDNLVAYNLLYKLIFDVAEKYKSLFDPIYLVSLLFNVPGLMISIYSVIWNIKQENLNVPIKTRLDLDRFTVLVTLLITLAPAFCAEKLSSEAEKVKHVLYDKLLLEKDESKCREIERFIRYVAARPLKFTVYKVIPLDANLLGIVLHFCVTYLIVIIQFTHLY